MAEKVIRINLEVKKRQNFIQQDVIVEFKGLDIGA